MAHVAHRILLLILLLISGVSFGQTAFKEELPTGKVNRKVKDHENESIPKEKEIKYIYVEDAGKALIGNPCAIEYTRSLGFEYELWHRPDNRFKSLWNRLWHNTFIKTQLFFTKGPTWKAKVKKRLKECAIQSGDFRG